MQYEQDIRSYLDILEFYMQDVSIPDAHEETVPVEHDVHDNRIPSLLDLVFRMRAYSEPSGGEYALGFEQGLEMAAQMLENWIKGEQSGS